MTGRKMVKMEFKIDHTKLKELLMDEDSDMLTVVSALCLYAEGMNAEQVSRPMKNAEIACLEGLGDWQADKLARQATIRKRAVEKRIRDLTEGQP